MLRTLLVIAVASLASTPPAHARAARPQAEKPPTVEEALDSAEHALDSGGDASKISERLHKTRGLTKDELARLELIDARCALLSGSYASSEKVFAKLHKAAPTDARLKEWYGRALDGSGKGDAALPILKELADSDKLRDGDSYFALAQLERKSGDKKQALAHAKLALEHPIVLQSDELDKEIQKFIAELGEKSK